MQKRYQWCSTHEDGYPVIREARGNRFSATTASSPTMTLSASTPVKIKPMQLLSAAAVEPKTPGSKVLPITSKLKPVPSVPAAPDSLPREYKFCVQQSDDGTRFLRFRDPTHKMHGKDVTESSECVVDADGNTMCHGSQGDASWSAPVCEQPEADKEPLPRGCCYDVDSSTLICPGSAYDGLVVSMIEGTEHEIGGVAHVSVQHPDLPGGGARPAVCTEVVPPHIGTLAIPEHTDRPGDGEPECCVEISSSTLQRCKDPSLNGTPVEIKGAPGPKGIPVHVPSMNWKGYLPVCAAISAVPVPGDRPDRPGPEEPECCVDLNTSTLQQCKNPELNGTPVNIKSAAGPQGVLVGIPSLGWKGYLPVCATIAVPPPVIEEPPETLPDICCFDTGTSSLVCEGTSLHGLVVELVTMATLADGTEIASVKHPDLPGGGMRLIICEPSPPVVELPPDIPDIPPEEIPPEIDRVPERVPVPVPIPKPPVLEPIPKLPPPSPGLPEHCCYSYAESTLECAGTELNGLKVRLVSEGAIKEGWPVVKVEHPRLPGGYAVVPVCVTDCMSGWRQVLDRSAARDAAPHPQPGQLERWTEMAMAIAHASDSDCPGRRFSATNGCLQSALGDGCIGGTGISDRHKEYAPLPGLRGWQKDFVG